MKEKTDQTPAAPATPDMTVLLGRLEHALGVQTAELVKLGEAIQKNTASTTALEQKFGQLLVSAPRRKMADATPLTTEQIKDILRLRPSASFRVLAPITHPGYARDIGAIIRPQTMQPDLWRALLLQRVQLEDADANP